MGKIQKCIGFVCLLGMLALGDVQIVEGNTELETSLTGTELYGYQSFSSNQNAQLFYQEIDKAMCDFVDARKDVLPKGDADYCVVANVNFKKYDLSLNEAQVVYQYYSYDHPEYFWLASAFSYSATDLYILMNEKYHEASIRESYNQQLNALAEYVVNNTTGYSDDERVSFIHDMIISNTNYAYYPGTKTPVEEDWAHCVTGYLDEKGVVCEGYAKVFQFLLNQVGIENIFVTGMSRKESHAWNMVKMDDDNWYWFDLTWDDRDLASSSANRVYYAMPDSLFTRDHIVYDDNVNNEWGCALYVLPKASDTYTYYCTPSISKVDVVSESQTVGIVQETVKEAVAKGSNCAAFYFPSEKQYKKFSDLMFSGIAQEDGSSLYYYRMFLDQIPEVREVLGDDISYQRVGDYLYMYFEYAKEQKLPAITLYENGRRAATCGTVQEAFEKMKYATADYEIYFEEGSPIHMLPLNMEIPKVKSLTFDGTAVEDGQVSFLFLPEDVTLTSDIILKDVCVMGIKDTSTKLDLNGHQLNAAGDSVYLGNTSSAGNQSVCVNGTNGTVVVERGVQLYIQDRIQISKMVTQDEGWIYFYGGGTIDRYEAMGSNDYLILDDKELSIGEILGLAYVCPKEDGAYICNINQIGINSRIGFVIYPKTKTRIKIADTVQGNVIALCDFTGIKPDDYSTLSRTAYIYAPKMMDNQVQCRVLNDQGSYEDLGWELKKKSDCWFYLSEPGQNDGTTGEYFENSSSKNKGTNTSKKEKKTSENILTIGSKATDSDGSVFRVLTNKGALTVAYVNPKKDSKGKITVPDTVVINDVAYKVVRIESKAFKGNKNIKEIKIGSNVKEIGKEAFSSCAKLKKITVRSSEITSVGKNAFKGIHKKATVKVPKAKLQSYTKLFKKKGLAKTAKVKK